MQTKLEVIGVTNPIETRNTIPIGWLGTEDIDVAFTTGSIV
jgi:hypothetical protein